MVIDRSALIAILTGEVERHIFNRKIAEANQRLMSAGSYLETSIVIEARYGYEGIRDFNFYINEAKIEIIAFDLEQAEVAKLAYTKYGKGKHPAKLNFGDSFAYALAKIRDQELLFKGDDFSKTDIQIA